MGITGDKVNWYRFLDLHRPMQTTSQLLLWVMGRIKRLQRGYGVSYCKNVKDCIALACTDSSAPISYTLFIEHSAQPTKRQRQARLGKRCVEATWQPETSEFHKTARTEASIDFSS